MIHAEFIAAYRSGRIRVHIDRNRAASLVSARMLLPFVLLPVFGFAVALALLGYVPAALAVFALALGFRAVVRTSSQGYLLARALREPRIYEELLAAGVLCVEDSAQSLPSRSS